MSAANEYPIGGDLTDDRVTGLLHSTLERLAQRTSKNNTHITNIHNGVSPEGIDLKTNFSSPGIVSWAKDPNNTGVSQVARYNWGCSWCCASGYFWYEATVEPGTKTLTFERYRRMSVNASAAIIREEDETIYCQNLSIEIHNSIKAVFSGSDSTGVPINGTIKGTITFQLPKDFKGFRPNGIELDYRSKGTGMGTSGTPTLTLTVTVYKSHCTNLLDSVAMDIKTYVQNTAPVGVTPEGAGIADSIQHDIFRITAEQLGSLWKPEDTVRLDVDLSHNVSGVITSLELHTGVLKIHYK